MSVVQVAFDLPPEIQKGLAEGALELGGLVIRNAAKGSGKGQIVKHIKPIGLEAAKEAKQVAGKAVQLAKNNPKIAIIVGAGGAVVAVGAGGVAVAKEIKKRKVSKEVKALQHALEEYYKAAKKMKLSVELMDCVIKALDDIDSSPKKDELWKQIDAKELYQFITYMREYTIKLSEANSIDIGSDIKRTDNNVIDIRHLMQAQKKIFEQAA